MKVVIGSFFNSKICRTDEKTDSSRFIFYKAILDL